MQFRQVVFMKAEEEEEEKENKKDKVLKNRS